MRSKVFFFLKWSSSQALQIAAFVLGMFIANIFQQKNISKEHLLQKVLDEKKQEEIRRRRLLDSLKKINKEKMIRLAPISP